MEKRKINFLFLMLNQLYIYTDGEFIQAIS